MATSTTSRSSTPRSRKVSISTSPGATVISGNEIVRDSKDFVDLTVGEIRTKFRDVLNIADSARAMVSRPGSYSPAPRTVDDTYRINEGDELTFSRLVGHKG
jgi:hypothetical protein